MCSDGVQIGGALRLRPDGRALVVDVGILVVAPGELVVVLVLWRGVARRPC